MRHNLLDDPVRQVAGGQEPVVAVGQDGAGKGHGVVEADTAGPQGVPGGEDGLAGVHHQEVACAAPALHGGQVIGADLPVEQDGAVQVSGYELAHGYVLLRCG